MGRNEIENLTSRLRAARREAQLSLTTFATRVGYSRSYLSAVELGHLPETEPIVMAYETGLGLPRGSLLEGKQSVARVLHRVSTLSTGDRDARSGARLRMPVGKMELLSRNEVLRAMATLALEAVDAGIPAGEVFITSYSDADDWTTIASEDDPMTAAVFALLNAGWRVNQLVRLNQDVSRSLVLMEGMLGLLAASREYRVLFAPGGAELTPAADLVVIEGHSALIRFDTHDPDTQAVMVVNEASGVKALIENAELMRSQMQPLIESVSFEDPVNFEAVLIRTESQPGDRALVRGTIGVAEFDNALMSADEIPQPELADPRRAQARLSQLSKPRLDRLVSTLAKNRVRHIYIKSKIEESVDFSRQVGEGLVIGEAEARFDPANVRRHLQSLLALLKAHPNFELALLDDDESSLIEASRGESLVYWLVQGDKLLLESWPRVGEGAANHLHIAVHEPSLAAAFMEHFKNVWARINPLNRDRDYVIWWFEQQLEKLSAV